MASLKITLILLVCLIPMEPAVAGSESETVVMVLPSGDAAAGRQAFIDLSCTACHRVWMENGFPEPFSAAIGPELGPHQAGQQPGRLATSIVAPSHVISEDVKKQMKASLSPMGDFSQIMTVRQLIDLIAYIRSRTPSQAR